MAKAKLKDVLSQRADETHLQWQARIAARRVTGETRDVLNPFVAQHGEYVSAFIHHDETSTKTQTKRNRVCNILEKWIDEGGIGYEADAVSFIRKCQSHWEIIGNPKVTANYGERIYGDGGDGMAAHEARSEINYYADLLNAPPYWRVFENVVRHNQPAGIAGSDLAENPATRIASAKAVVGLVASSLASKLNA